MGKNKHLTNSQGGYVDALEISCLIWVEFGIFFFQDVGLSPAKLQKIAVKIFLTVLVKVNKKS